MERETRNKLIEFIVFVSVLNIPFLSIASTIGFETFLDSFEHPQDYEWFSNMNLQGVTSETSNIIVQKTHHPDFTLTYGDTIVYFQENMGFQCGQIDLVSTECHQKIYYIILEEQPLSYQPVFEEQVVGKILHTIDNDIWNSLTLELWQTATMRLNLISFFSSN
ncbi:MAG: hypothetical protein KKC68_05440 [Candidatus Thermoplasmatota archaeon]|nr:hypothetical protein [Candidatus Thermoplasmatota archaeon]MBU1941198.1 hypothetical protein [Candidatus Thermoplasmatota archaeon]